MSIRQACVLFCISQSVYRYRPKRKDDHVVSKQLSALAELNGSWGFWMMHHHLRRVGWLWNHKKVYRIYTQMKLNIRRKYKRRLPARVKEPLLQPIAPNVTWSMDFMHDGLIDGKRFRSFNVIDDYNREVLNITIEKGMPSKRVVGELDRLIEWRGLPERIRVDNGPEFLSHTMQRWCQEKEIELKFIQKGKPSQNGYIERFNRTFREDVLDRYAFDSLEQARTYAYAWMWRYNNERPHSSLGWKSPIDFMQERLRGSAPPTFLHDQDKTWKSLILTAPK